MRTLSLLVVLAFAASALAEVPNADVQLEKLRDDVSQLLVMRETVAAHLKDLQDEVAKVESVDASGNSQLGRTLAEIELQHLRMDEISTNLKELQLEISERERAAEEAAKGRSEEQQKAQENLEKLREDADTQANSLAMRGVDLENVRRAFDKALNELTTCTAENAEATAEVNKLKAKAGELGSSAAQLGRERDAISAALGKLRDDQREYTGQVEEASRAQREAEAQANELDEKLAKLMETLSQRRAELSEAVVTTETQRAAPVDESAAKLAAQYGGGGSGDEEMDDLLKMYSMLQVRSKEQTRHLRARRAAVGEGAGRGSDEAGEATAEASAEAEPAPAAEAEVGGAAAEAGAGEAGAAAEPEAAPAAEPEPVAPAPVAAPEPVAAAGEEAGEGSVAAAGAHPTVRAMEEARASASKLKNGATALLGKLKGMCDQADQLQSKLDGFQLSKAQLEQLIRAAENLKQAYEAERQSMELQAQREADLVTRHETLMRKLRADIAELEASIRSGMADLNAVEVRLDEARRSLQKVADQVKECVAASASLRDEMAAVTVQVRGLHDEYLLMERENARMERERDELERLLDDETTGLRAQARQAREEAQRARAKVTDLEGSVEGYQFGIKSTEDRLAQERAKHASP